VAAKINSVAVAEWQIDSGNGSGTVAVAEWQNGRLTVAVALAARVAVAVVAVAAPTDGTSGFRQCTR
jgi:hypothetical protein